MRNEAGPGRGRCGTGRGWNGMSAGERMRHFKPPAVTFPGGTGFIRGPRVSRTVFCAY